VPTTTTTTTTITTKTTTETTTTTTTKRIRTTIGGQSIWSYCLTNVITSV
jgi:hypothetical protein